MRCEKFVKLFSVVTLEFNHSIIENMDNWSCLCKSKYDNSRSPWCTKVL